MSLYKQKGGTIWWASISIPGRPRVRESTGETDRAKAEAFEDERRVALRKESPALRGMTWSKAVMKWVEVEERSDSELLSLAKFGRVFPDRVLSAVRAEDIEAALSFCQTAGTYTRYRTMISAILNLSGVKLKIAIRKDKKKKPRKWITHEQWAKLYAELPAHMKPMAHFAVTTGLRQDNVLSLTWDRVDLQKKIVWIEAEDTKGDEGIAVPLSKESLKILKGQVGQNDVFVFTYRGRPVSEVKTAWQAACVRAGVGHYNDQGHYEGFTWHGLRHTWATWHIQNKTPLEVLQKLGGWSDLRMVLNYAHRSAGHLAQYADNSKTTVRSRARASSQKVDNNEKGELAGIQARKQVNSRRNK